MLRPEDLAVNFLRNGLSLELATLALGLNRAVTEGFLDLSIDLGGAFSSIDGSSVHLLFVSLHLECVAANVLKIHKIVDVS